MPITAGSGCYLDYEGTVEGEATLETIEYYVSIENSDQPPQQCPPPFFEDPSWIEESGDTYIDADKDGADSPGDSYVFDSNPIEAGRQQGTTSGDCVNLVEERFDNTYCQITYEFREGSLMVQGVFGAMVIVGGTGCFRQAKGIVAGETIEDGAFFRHNVTLSEGPPDSCNNEELFEATWKEVGQDFLSDIDGSGGPSVGELFVFENHPITVGNSAQPTGLASGRCALLPGFEENDNLVYCLISFAFDEGILVVQGLYPEMEIVGGSGCFVNVQGRMLSSDADDGYQYSFELYD